MAVVQLGNAFLIVTLACLFLQESYGIIFNDDSFIVHKFSIGNGIILDLLRYFINKINISYRFKSSTKMLPVPLLGNLSGWRL
jgi:hypothetical protein